MIPIETNSIESISIEDLSTPQHSENEDEEIEASQDQNKQLSSSIKLLQSFGLPTFDNENVTTQDATNLTQASYWYAIYTIPIITFGIMCTLIYTLVPQHNHFESPEYWYELPLTMPFWGTTILPALNYILLCYYVFNVECMVSFRTFFSIYIPLLMAMVVPYCVGTLIWTITLSYNPPLPMIGRLSLLFSFPAVIASLWIQLSSKFKRSGDAKRIMWVLITIHYYLIVHVTYVIAGAYVVERLPGSLQWIIAIVLPILKEFHLWVWTKMAIKTKPCNLEATLNWNTIRLECYHSFYEATLLQNINTITMYSMLFVGFLFHLRACYKIVQKHNKVTYDNVTFEQERKDMQKDVQDLVLSESLEVFTPIAYSIAVIIAYIGPNATILGNIRNSYWHYEAMTSLEPFLSEEFQMVAIDLGVGVISGLILWKYCSINIVRQFCNLLKAYWAMICIMMASQLSFVSIIL